MVERGLAPAVIGFVSVNLQSRLGRRVFSSGLYRQAACNGSDAQEANMHNPDLELGIFPRQVEAPFQRSIPRVS